MEINGGNGGLHGALKNVAFDDVYLIDVVSFYPSIMVNKPELLPKCRYKNRYADMLQMKMDGHKELKLLLNKCYGLNSPEKRKQICEYGQTIMHALINAVEGNLIQINTDGIIVKNPNLKTVGKWEDTYNMKCKITHYKKIVQKDINNYCALMEDRTIIKKGAILNHRGIQYDCVARYLLDGTPLPEGVRNGTILDYCIIHNPADWYEVEGEKCRNQCDLCRYVLAREGIGTGLVIDNIKVAESAVVLMGELKNYSIMELDYTTYLYMAEKVLQKWEN